jgi:addiction module RelE/StbE family toxin
MELQWSPRSERELMQLRDFIAQDSPFYARQFIERIIAAVERLPTLPRSGRTVPEAGHNDAIREMILQGYRIIYRIRSESLLEIVTVLHGSRDLERMEPPWSS